jgi:hypothetical protein
LLFWLRNERKLLNSKKECLLAVVEIFHNRIAKLVMLWVLLLVFQRKLAEIAVLAEERKKAGVNLTENFGKVDRHDRETSAHVGSFVGVSGKTLEKAA